MLNRKCTQQTKFGGFLQRHNRLPEARDAEERRDRQGFEETVTTPERVKP